MARKESTTNKLAHNSSYVYMPQAMIENFKIEDYPTFLQYILRVKYINIRWHAVHRWLLVPEEFLM